MTVERVVDLPGGPLLGRRDHELDLGAAKLNLLRPAIWPNNPTMRGRMAIWFSFGEESPREFLSDEVHRLHRERKSP